MTKEQIEEKLEEVALLVMMLGPGDAQGFQMIFAALNEIAEATASNSELSSIAESCAAFVKSASGKSDEDLIDELGDFVSKLQNFLRAPGSVDLSASSSESSSGWEADLSDQADDELIVEFIEKHSSLLDDFEAEIISVISSGDKEESELETFRAFVKAYLHNVKGDAGSVGLSGVERVTHSVEDRLLEQKAETLHELLLSYREWVIAVMNAYSQGEAPTVLSEAFLSGEQPSAPPQAASAPKPTVREPQREETFPQEAAPLNEPSKVKLPAPYKISGDVDILSEFMAEAEEHLGAIEDLLMNKEDSYDLDDLDTIFRAMHSIKGGSSYFNLREITTTSHSCENLMDKARNGQIVFNRALKAIVLSYIDITRSLLEGAKESLENGEPINPLAEAQVFLGSIDDYLRSITMIAELDLDSFILDDDDEQEEQLAAVVTSSTDRAAATASQAIEKSSSAKQSAPSAAPSSKPSESDSSGKKAQVKSFVKIETKRLDHLLEYIGEMVISSSMLIKNCRDLLSENESVVNNSDQLERICREIQGIGMSMRLIPIKGLFQKMSRVVWDTAKKLGKDIRFEMNGEDTELDRTVIEKLADPLMHMVRNAVDHGIESAEDRVDSNKNQQGCVELKAYQAGGSIFIQIKDDGKGLDPEKLKNIARSKGILGQDEEITDEEAYMLIFAAGFSTAERVTDVSGRGVGMDVVRRNIESMRGRVSIQSELGFGSTFTIELPLTLAITEGIEATVGDEHFIIPNLSIVEFLKPTPDMIMHTLDRGETLKFRGSFLPIFRVSELYDIEPRFSEPSEGILVIVENGPHLVALLVDEVLGKLSAVIKSLGSLFGDVEGVSGCAIMPNGSIGLIVDIQSLVTLGESLPAAGAKKLPPTQTLQQVMEEGKNLH